MDARSLFRLYELPPGATPEEIRAAIASRRAWAQAQWTNAKWREKALSILRDHGRHLAILLAWTPPSGQGYPRQALEALDGFIRGCGHSRIDDGQLMRLAGLHADQLGLPEAFGRRRAAQLLGLDPALRDRVVAEDPAKVVEFDDEPSIVLR